MTELYSAGADNASAPGTPRHSADCKSAIERPKRALQIRQPGVELSRLHRSNMRSTVSMSIYPERAVERDQWIVARRPLRNPVDPRRPYAFLLEEERAESGEVVSVATIFLANRECPWRCLMCDLWKNTLTETVPVGAIPAQIDYALKRLGGPGCNPKPAKTGRAQVRDKVELAQTVKIPLSPSDGQRGVPPINLTRRSTDFTGAPIKQIKLYNSGSFFDPRAIPPEDHEAIAHRVAAFERVIVECHPALIGESAPRFRGVLMNPNVTSSGRSTSRRDGGHLPPTRLGGEGPTLEVAMGLETAQPNVLAKLNKRMTLEQFRRAAESLRENEIPLRVFVLVKPPFLDEIEALRWARRSVDFAFDCGAAAVSLIPTRFGNGALETLARRGEFSPPKLSTLEAALEYGIRLKRGRVFADLWDLEIFSDCAECFQERCGRLHRVNLEQALRPPVVCKRCRGRCT